MYSSWKKQPEVNYQEDWVILFGGHPWGYRMTERQKDAVPGECSGSWACLGVSLLSIKLVWAWQRAQGRRRASEIGSAASQRALADSSTSLPSAPAGRGRELSPDTNRAADLVFHMQSLTLSGKAEQKSALKLWHFCLGVTMLNSPTPIFTNLFPA